MRGCRELVNPDVNGFVVQPKDPQNLARVLELLTQKDEKQFREMGLASRELVQNSFSLKAVIEAYTAILHGAKLEL
jgi:galacturonosyltransferase